MYDFLGWQKEDATFFLQQKEETHDRVVDIIRHSMIATLLHYPERNASIIPQQDQYTRPNWDISSSESESESDSESDEDDKDYSLYKCHVCGDFTYLSRRSNNLVCLIPSCIKQSLLQYARYLSSS